jgi:purine-binding chemotaxis protein CheW
MSERLKQVLQNQQNQANQPEVNKDDGIVQLVGFMVGNEEFAVPILNIQEIIKPIASTRVPATPAYVVGVFNLRGTVIPLLDLRQKFGLPGQKQNEDTRFIVIKNEVETIGFVIDKLTEAIRLKEKHIDPAPESVSGKENHIYGVGKKEEKIITILRVDALLKRNFD